MLRHKGERKGGPQNLQELKKKAGIKMVICLVNFYEGPVSRSTQVKSQGDIHKA